MLLASADSYTPTGTLRYPPAASYQRAFVAGLGDPVRRVDGLRGRWEDLGAGEALLLDRLAAGWHEAVLS